MGNKNFRQIIGISIGCNLAPFFANLSLFYFKIKWTKKVKKNDIR